MKTSREPSRERAFAVKVDVFVEEGVFSTIGEDTIVEMVPRILRRESAVGTWSVTVVLTTDDRLRQLHQDFLAIDDFTDVMTFPVEPDLGEQVNGGDIVVSIERAADQAGDYGHTTDEEIRFLIVHGLLHLCGWTDESAARRDAMLARQEELIAELTGCAFAL